MLVCPLIKVNVPVYRWRCAVVVMKPAMVKNSGLARLVWCLLIKYVCPYRLMVQLVDVMAEDMLGLMRLV